MNDVDIGSHYSGGDDTLSLSSYRELLSQLTALYISTDGDPDEAVKALELQLDVTKSRYNADAHGRGAAFEYTCVDESSARAPGPVDEGVEWSANGRR